MIKLKWNWRIILICMMTVLMTVNLYYVVQIMKQNSLLHEQNQQLRELNIKLGNMLNGDCGNESIIEAQNAK